MCVDQCLYMIKSVN